MSLDLKVEDEVRKKLEKLGVLPPLRKYEYEEDSIDGSKIVCFEPGEMTVQDLLAIVITEFPGRLFSDNYSVLLETGEETPPRIRCLLSYE